MCCAGLKGGLPRAALGEMDTVTYSVSDNVLLGGMFWSEISVSNKLYFRVLFLSSLADITIALYIVIR